MNLKLKLILAVIICCAALFLLVPSSRAVCFGGGCTYNDCNTYCNETCGGGVDGTCLYCYITNDFYCKCGKGGTCT